MQIATSYGAFPTSDQNLLPCFTLLRMAPNRCVASKEFARRIFPPLVAFLCRIPSFHPQKINFPVE